jgi:hypothetical protein
LTSRSFRSPNDRVNSHFLFKFVPNDFFGSCLTHIKTFSFKKKEGKIKAKCDIARKREFIQLFLQ